MPSEKELNSMMVAMDKDRNGTVSLEASLEVLGGSELPWLKHRQQHVNASMAAPQAPSMTALAQLAGLLYQCCDF